MVLVVDGDDWLGKLSAGRPSLQSAADIVGSPVPSPATAQALRHVPIGELRRESPTPFGE